MTSLAHVAVHRSQFPEQVRQDLLLSLRSGKVNHKFHYDSFRQVRKWLALHQACSPSRADSNCAALYDHAFSEAAARITAPNVHLIGLGCGGGRKDARLLQTLSQADKQVSYTPIDVGLAMVLAALHTVLEAIPKANCSPLICDLASAEDLPVVLDQIAERSSPRLLSFLGMMPNFEPQMILPRLSSLVRPQDCLLLSANLAPGPDYAAGLQRILPLYDNDLTRDWLMTFLLDLGIETSAGALHFVIEDGCAVGLKRIAAYFHFTTRQAVCIDDESLEFHSGNSLRLFFSYRHTPALTRDLLCQHGLEVQDQWIAPSREEAVFLVVRARSQSAGS
jgi:L-histidine Nalpha-methyltransferase